MITANDDQIRDAVERANRVFADAGITPEQAYQDNITSIEKDGSQTEVWSKADLEATRDMGEGALLAWH
jgi:hypothetical protein